MAESKAITAAELVEFLARLGSTPDAKQSGEGYTVFQHPHRALPIILHNVEPRTSEEPKGDIHPCRANGECPLSVRDPSWTIGVGAGSATAGSDATPTASDAGWKRRSSGQVYRPSFFVRVVSCNREVPGSPTIVRTL